jgi:hypothetical protein
MRSRTLLSRVVPYLLLGSIAAPLACKSSDPEPAPPQVSRGQISNEYTSVARVVAVSPSDRIVTLSREDGSQFPVQCGSAVANFGQIAVGDVVRVRYQETLVAEKLPAGTKVGPGEGAITSAKARAGAKPGAGAGMAFSLPVRIESIDRELGIVTFSPESGELISRRIKTPQGKEFVQGLKVGDVVQLNYAEVIALTVEEL